MDIAHNKLVQEVLTKHGRDGATISEIVEATGLTRDNVRIALAALEGAGKAVARNVGKAKLYRIQ
jgi:DNA-binding transcriptional ArsR family regulator